MAPVIGITFELPPGRPIVSTKENTVPLQDAHLNLMLSWRGKVFQPDTYGD